MNDTRQPVHAVAGDAAFLSQLLAAAGEAIIATDLDGVVRYWNRAAEQMYGWPAEEAIGQMIHNLTVPQLSADEGMAIMSRVIEGKTWSGEFPVRRRDGRQFRAHVIDTPVLDEHGEVVGVVGVSRDITEKMQAQEALETSERRWRSLSEATPALICETDEESRPVYCNRRFEQYSGLGLDDLRRDGWEAVVHEEDRGTVRAPRIHAAKTGVPFSAELRLRSAAGAYRWHLTFAEPRTREGATQGWVWAAVDVHDQRLTEERLRSANAAKDEFLGLVSHELKSPMTMILGNAELLSRRRQMLSDTAIDTALDDIRGEANQLSEIIENMLILARLDDGASIETEPLRLERAAAQAIKRHRAQHPARNVRLEVPGEVPLVDASAMYVQQILGNLLSNAEKYSPGSRPIDVQVRSKPGVVETTVADRGPGVAEHEIENVLRPFYRSANARSAPGVGIGLAVCRRLSEAMGGDLRLQRREGGGLVAKLSLHASEG